MTTDWLLGRDRIEYLLAELGRRCAAAGIDAELFIVGGGAMALAYSRERVTRDLDAVFEPKALVYAEARRMALAGILRVTRPDQAFAIIERYYSRKRLGPKSRFFIEHTFARARPDVGAG